MQIKILQWNIWNKEKIENIVKTIKEINPDIACLQELALRCKYNPCVPDTPKYVGDELKFNGFFQAAHYLPNSNKLYAQGNGIFTRFPATKTFFKLIQKQSAEGDPSQEGRAYMETKIKINSKEITIGTTHLSYTHKFEDTEKKRQEVNNLLAIINRKKENFVFTGDLNSTPDSYLIKKLGKLFQCCGPDYSKKTWTTKPFEHKGFKEDKLNWRLDYVFATKDVRCISSEIIKTKYSDHLPILVKILL